MALSELVTSLRNVGVLKSKRLADALSNVDRKQFVPKEFEALAYKDEALPIGQGQTISQPYTVVFMLELLKPMLGEYIMDIGAGSGWQSALLAEIVGPKGHVYAIEIIPKLSALAQESIRNYPELMKRITWFTQDAASGLPKEAKKAGGFDGVIAAAEVEKVPLVWREQLKPGGRLVYPKTESIFLEIKKRDRTFSVQEYPGFAFVPFV